MTLPRVARGNPSCETRPHRRSRGRVPAAAKKKRAKKFKTFRVDISPAGLLAAALTAKDPLERIASRFALHELCPNFPPDLTPFYDMPQYRSR